MINKIIQPDGWAPAKGYANGVLTRGKTLYIGGQIGWNSEKVFVSKDFIGQMEQVLNNIKKIVETAGGQVENITRLTWFLIDKNDYLSNQRNVGEAYRLVFGRHFPAMSVVVVKELIEDKALIEIEATAEL